MCYSVVHDGTKDSFDCSIVHPDLPAVNHRWNNRNCIEIVDNNFQKKWLRIVISNLFFESNLLFRSLETDDSKTVNFYYNRCWRCPWFDSREPRTRPSSRWRSMAYRKISSSGRASVVGRGVTRGVITLNDPRGGSLTIVNAVARRMGPRRRLGPPFKRPFHVLASCESAD